MDYIASARAAILDLGSEDYYHLGDAAAYLPTVPADQRESAAREAMLQLVEEGLVDLFFGRMATNDVVRVPLDQVPALLNNPRSWDPEADLNHQSYCFLNTDRGDAVYRSGRSREL